MVKKQAISDQLHKQGCTTEYTAFKGIAKLDLTSKVSKPAPTDAALRLKPVTKDAAKITKKVDWLIYRALRKAGICFVYGDSQAGKTFFVNDIAMHIAGGIPWRGRETKQGKVLYIAAEASNEFMLRVDAFDQFKQKVPDDNFMVIGEAPDFTKEQDLEIILGWIDELDVSFDLIVVDTLSQVSLGLDENSSLMGEVLKKFQTLREKTGATILVVSHTGKNPERGMRGWSGWKPAADHFIYVSNVDGTRRIAKAEKNKGLPEGEEYEFALREVNLVTPTEEDPEPINPCVVDHILDHKKEASWVDQLLLAIVKHPNLKQSEVLKVMQAEQPLATSLNAGNVSHWVKDTLLPKKWVTKTTENTLVATKLGETHVQATFKFKKPTAAELSALVGDL